MKYLNNYAHMYTLYQCISVILVLLFPKLIPELFIDIVRASCITIAIIWSYVYFYFGYNEIMRIYAKLFPFIPSNLREYIYPIMDFICHYLVVYLVGLPKYPISIIYSSLIILTWFELNKQNISNIYGLTVF